MTAQVVKMAAWMEAGGGCASVNAAVQTLITLPGAEEHARCHSVRMLAAAPSSDARARMRGHGASFSTCTFNVLSDLQMGASHQQ